LQFPQSAVKDQRDSEVATSANLSLYVAATGPMGPIMNKLTLVYDTAEVMTPKWFFD
jgi:hypothetical protein